MKTNIYIEPQKNSYLPLEEIVIHGVNKSKINVLDAAGDCYIENFCSSDKFSFLCGGALGIHNIIIHRNDDKTVNIRFKVDCETMIEDSKKIFSKFLEILYLTMVRSCGSDGCQYVKINGKIYSYFICWLRDHTHVLKGMKYFASDIKKAVELYANTQRSDGMFFERIAPKENDVQCWRDYTFKEGDFIRTVYSETNGRGEPYTLQRIPVENDVEYLFIECLYYTWKATGDSEWMKKYLDHCIKAVNYATSDKYRWSKKYGLLKRAYTIDTWDFIHEDDLKYTLGDNCFNPVKTVFGVMFGDNTGFAASCRYLAEMLEHSGREKEAKKYRKLADEILKRLEKISWNGRFYIHHVSEDPSFKRDVGKTDEKRQVTLSNSYSINRGIGEGKVFKIIETYKNIRKEMPKNSPGEFYNCYPPFEKGFDDADVMWQYMNGGVSTIVAGELSRGAFFAGEEEYAVDILKRIIKLTEKHNGYLHVCFNGNPQTKAPKRKFSILDITKFANVTKTWRKKGGWGDSGNDLSALPEGRQTFANIPFNISESGLGISYVKEGYAKEISIGISAKFASLYLLHTLSGADRIAAEMELKYDDGTSKTVYIENGKNIGNWFMPESSEKRSFVKINHKKGWPDYQLAWRGSSGKFENVGVYIWGFDNPFPEKKVESISFRAMKNSAVYFVPAITLCDVPVWFPQSEISFGIPDAWGAAAMVYALIEGLAGVVDKGIAFDRAEISPRWDFAGEKLAKVFVKYPGSESYTAYSWKKNNKRIEMLISGSGDQITVKLPVKNSCNAKIIIDGKEIKYKIEKIRDKAYATFEITKKGVRKIFLFE